MKTQTTSHIDELLSSPKVLVSQQFLNYADVVASLEHNHQCGYAENLKSLIQSLNGRLKAEVPATLSLLRILVQ